MVKRLNSTIVNQSKKMTSIRRRIEVKSADGQNEKKGEPLAPLYDVAGKKIGDISLNPAVFGAFSNPDLIAQAVLVSLANQRLGTAKVKTRGEVLLTTKKMYRQKHTGRARHGAASAPIFVGGGVAHGPKPGQRVKQLSQVMRKKAIISILSQKQEEGKIVVLEKLFLSKISTKKAFDFVKKFGSVKGVLIVRAVANDIVERSFRNLPFVKTAAAENVDALNLLGSQLLLLEKGALAILEKRLALKNAA